MTSIRASPLMLPSIFMTCARPLPCGESDNDCDNTVERNDYIVKCGLLFVDPEKDRSDDRAADPRRDERAESTAVEDCGVTRVRHGPNCTTMATDNYGLRACSTVYIA